MQRAVYCWLKYQIVKCNIRLQNLLNFKYWKICCESVPIYNLLWNSAVCHIAISACVYFYAFVLLSFITFMFVLHSTLLRVLKIIKERMEWIEYCYLMYHCTSVHLMYQRTRDFPNNNLYWHYVWKRPYEITRATGIRSWAWKETEIHQIIFRLSDSDKRNDAKTGTSSLMLEYSICLCEI